MTGPNLPTVVPGQQPGETWEDFEHRVAQAFFAPTPVAHTGESPLIRFLRRRYEESKRYG